MREGSQAGTAKGDSGVAVEDRVEDRSIQGVVVMGIQARALRATSGGFSPRADTTQRGRSRPRDCFQVYTLPRTTWQGRAHAAGSRARVNHVVGWRCGSVGQGNIEGTVDAAGSSRTGFGFAPGG